MSNPLSNVNPLQIPVPLPFAHFSPPPLSFPLSKASMVLHRYGIMCEYLEDKA